MDTAEMETSSFIFGGDMYSSNSYEVNRLRQENKDLFLSKKYYKFQLEEEQQEKSILVSEVALLDRLLNERQIKNEEEQTRLIARYESQFEKLQAECNLQRIETHSVENRINEQVRKEGQLIKQIAEQELTIKKQNLRLKAAEKENEELKGKLTVAEERLSDADKTIQRKWYKRQMEQHRKLKNQEKEMMNLSCELEGVTRDLQQERDESQRSLADLTTKHELQLEALEIDVANKQLLMNERHSESITELERSLGEESKKTKFLYEKLHVIDEISKYHKKLFEKFRRVSEAKEEVNEKYEKSKRANKKLRGKVEVLKRLRGSSESEEEIRCLQRKCKELKAKEICLREDNKRISVKKHDLQEQVEQLKSTVEEMSSSAKENSQNIQKMETKNAGERLKSGKQIQELKQDKIQLKARLNGVENTLKRQEEETSKKMGLMENEIEKLKTDLEYEKRKNFELKQQQQQQVEELIDNPKVDDDSDNVVIKTRNIQPLNDDVTETDNNKNNNDNNNDDDDDECNYNGEYHYEDDFESSSEAQDDEICCKESVAEIESDCELVNETTNKMGLFFGVNKRQSDSQVPFVESRIGYSGDSLSAAQIHHGEAQEKQQTTKVSITNPPTSRTISTRNPPMTVNKIDVFGSSPKLSSLPKLKIKNKGKEKIRESQSTVQKEEKREKITANDIFRRSLSVVIEESDGGDPFADIDEILNSL